MPEYDPAWSRTVLAWDAQHAARIFVERFEGDECEYAVAEGKRTVTVQIDDEWFEVSGEIVPHYRAKSIKPPAELAEQLEEVEA